MRLRKIMRGAFYTSGQQTSFEAGNLSITARGNDWYIYYTDENSDAWKIAPTGTTYATASPILVDSTTTSIVVTPPTWAAPSSGDTQQLAVVNQDTVNVISECAFSTVAGTAVSGATVSASGLITIPIGDGTSWTGTTTIWTNHPDLPLYTGTTIVTAG